MFDVIERLKAEWTDKYVVIDSPAPELARFAEATGTVRTVNMNGRCLVEFDQFNNIGWYDIDPAFLKVVTEPRPKPEKPAKAAAKPVATEAAAKKPAAKAAAGKRPSTADILAAARGGAAAKPAAKPAGKLSTAEILAQARGAAAPAAAPAEEAPAPEPEPVADVSAEAAPEPAPAKAASGDLPTTTAEKIAWCRANDAS